MKKKKSSIHNVASFSPNPIFRNLFQISRAHQNTLEYLFRQQKRKKKNYAYTWCLIGSNDCDSFPYGFNGTPVPLPVGYGLRTRS